jgi:O-acetyl-ADP-ribose deacetylase (regulator of RNase III)
MVIEVSWLPIDAFPAEGLVNSSNAHLEMGSGTSALISNAAGSELEATLSELRTSSRLPLDLGSVVVTPSFKAGVPGVTRHILHAVTMGAWRPGGREYASPETVYDASRNVINCAAELGMRSVVFPLLAARAGYSNLECGPRDIRWVMATAMILGIKHGQRDAHEVEEVSISIPRHGNPYADEDIQMCRAIAKESHRRQENSPAQATLDQH